MGAPHVGVLVERQRREVVEGLSWMRVAFVGVLCRAFCGEFSYVSIGNGHTLYSGDGDLAGSQHGAQGQIKDIQEEIKAIIRLSSPNS